VSSTSRSGVNTLFGAAGEDSSSQPIESIFFSHVFRGSSEEHRHGDFGGDPGGVAQDVQDAQTGHRRT
jgi:hypothetical protein